MHKILIWSLFLNLGLVSCKNSENRIDNMEIAKKYFKALDTSDYSNINTWCSDTIVKTEGDYDETFSQSSFLELLKWDSVFKPSYDILEIAEEDGTIKAMIFKSDKRISFLQEEAMITNQVLKFKDGKINSIDIEYINFNNTVWERNKTALLSWIDNHHPELNGFIYDQTEVGGLKFLKALELYKDRQ